MKILITAFEPFGGEPVNPALETLRALPDTIDGAAIVKLTVPVSFARSVPVVLAAIRKESPDAVLCLGQAGGRAALTPERIAINLDDASIPDCDGAKPIDQPISKTGAPAYFATLPVKAMVTAIQAAGVPASLSNTAGTYVCNHLMYGVLEDLAEHAPDTIGGFMHLPYLHEQVADKPGKPSLSREEMVRGVEAAVMAIVECLKQK